MSSSSSLPGDVPAPVDGSGGQATISQVQGHGVQVNVGDMGRSKVGNVTFNENRKSRSTVVDSGHDLHLAVQTTTALPMRARTPRVGRRHCSSRLDLTRWIPAVLQSRRSALGRATGSWTRPSGARGNRASERRTALVYSGSKARQGQESRL